MSEKARSGLETTGQGWRGHCLGDTRVGYTYIESKLPMGSLQRWGGPTEKPGSHAHPQKVPTGPKEEAEPEGRANPDTRSGVAANRPLVTGKPISLLSTQSSWPITYTCVLCMSKAPPPGTPVPTRPEAVSTLFVAGALEPRTCSAHLARARGQGYLLNAAVPDEDVDTDAQTGITILHLSQPDQH